jgi:Pentapeptide repeats (8 copies)
MPDSSPSPSSPVPLSESVQIAEVHLSSQDQAQLLERIERGDLDALQTHLNHNLLPYQARVEDIGLRKEKLQLSISGPEVPQQERFEFLLQTWIVQLGLFQFSTIELYGQRDGSALPFWRCSFNPKDVDLESLAAIASPEVAFPEVDSLEVIPPIGFVDPLQVEFEKKIVDLVPDPWEQPPLEPIENNLWPESQPLVSDGIQGESQLDADLEKSEPSSPSQPSEEGTAEEKSKAVKDFLARYAAGERDFAKIQLNEADLSRVNLTLANLHKAELIWANLSEANLYHIDFSSAKLRQANLSGAMLRSSNLQGTDFINANLRGADLSWSNLNGANLTGADLTDANLKNAILERVILPDGTLLD